LSWHLVNKCDNPILSTRPFHRLAGDLLAVDLEHADAPASDAAYIVEGERANPQAILFEVEFERVLAGRQRLRRDLRRRAGKRRRSSSVQRMRGFIRKPLITSARIRGFRMRVPTLECILILRMLACARK
jgi:hypothetical protein